MYPAHPNQRWIYKVLDWDSEVKIERLNMKSNEEKIRQSKAELGWPDLPYAPREVHARIVMLLVRCHKIAE